MAKTSLEELAKDANRPTAGALLKYANELEIVAREDGYGFHYFIYIDREATGLLDTVLAELLPPEANRSACYILLPWQPRYWVSQNGDRNNPGDRRYATRSLARFSGSGRMTESVHFFLSREDFDIAAQYAMPAGWGNDE